MRRPSVTEWALLLIPLAIIPFAMRGARWQAATAPKPPLAVTAPPPPASNLFAYGKEGQFISIMPSPNGKVIHTTVQGAKSKFQTWDANSGELIRKFGAFAGVGGEAVLSPDGKILASEYRDGKNQSVMLLDSGTGKQRLNIPKQKRSTGHGFDISNDAIAIPTDDEMRIYSALDGRFQYLLRHRTRYFFPSQPRFSRDGTKLLWIGVTGQDYDKYADGDSADEIVWFDWKKRQRVHSIEFPQTNLFNARFAGDGKTILAYGFRRYWTGAGRKNGKWATDIRLFAVDTQTGRQLYSKHVSDWSNDIAVSPDGRWFTFPDKVTPEQDHITILAVRTGKEVHRMLGWHYATPGWSADSKSLYHGGRVLWRLQLQGKQWQADPKRSDRQPFEPGLQ